jgi:hypothetical protein
MHSGSWEKIALAIWATALIVILFRVAFSSSDSQSIYPVLSTAAQNWQAGQSLYILPHTDQHKPLYRYSPLVAALLTPLNLVPDSLGGILWRLINLTVFLGAFAWWMRSVLPQPISREQAALMFLLLVPMSLSSFNNAQANLLLIGLLMGALAATAEERWPLAGGLIALATILKVYPVAIGMLLALVHPRRFLPWFALALLVALAAPFALQRPDYVLGQYLDWIHYLSLDDRSGFTPDGAYRDIRLLLTVWICKPSPELYVLLQLLGAAGCAALCLAGRLLAWPRRRLLTLLLGLGCCWMTLLGPSTESNTYNLLGPTLAWALLQAWRESAPRGTRGLLTLSFGLFLVTKFAVWFPDGRGTVHALGLHPLAALLLLAGILLQEYRWFTRSGLERNTADVLQPAQAA